MRRPRLVVTDLDNTLYDWVTYFATAFYAMVDELTRIAPLDREQLLDGFRDVHRRHHNSEHPYAVLEVEAVSRHFEGLSPSEVLRALDPALHAFNSTRKRTLRLYDGVIETLRRLNDRGISIVGHTEAVVTNAYFRLELLDIRPLLKHLYALQGSEGPHPSGGPRHSPAPPDFVQIVPRAERKPNPALLQDICAREAVAPADTWYVGDSLTRDMSMAKRAGVVAIWARYGTKIRQEDWTRLVRVTHWTEDDIARETELKREFAKVNPDHTIDAFPELIEAMD